MLQQSLLTMGNYWKQKIRIAQELTSGGEIFLINEVLQNNIGSISHQSQPQVLKRFLP